MRIFKYLHPDRIDVLKNQSIRFTQPKHLNDKFELRPSFSQLASEDNFDGVIETYVNKIIEAGNFNELLENAVKNYSGQFQYVDLKAQMAIYQGLDNARLKVLLMEIFQPFKPFFIDKLKQSSVSDKFVEGLNSTIGLLSLSKKNDIELMWAHYACANSGYVIEFNPNSDFFTNPKSSLLLLRKLQKVIYVESRPDIKLFDYAHATQNDIEEICVHVFLSKNHRWSYEQEIRLFKSLSESSFKIEVGGQDIHLFKFDPSTILNVYLGSEVSSSFEENVKSILNEARYLHVELFKEDRDSNGYEANFLKISKLLPSHGSVTL